MNPTKHTPWSCRLVRVGASLSHDGQVNFWARRHLDGCPSCQEYYTAATALEQGLRAAAPTRSAAPRASFEQDIMREIMGTAGTVGAGLPRDGVRIASRNPAHRRLRVWPTFAVAASAACAVALVFVQRPRQVTPAAGAAAPRAVSVATAPAAQPTPWAQLATPVRTLLNEDPLQSEARQVVAEARSAVDFLALNFLPNTSGTETDPSL